MGRKLVSRIQIEIGRRIQMGGRRIQMQSMAESVGEGSIRVGSLLPMHIAKP